MQRAEDQYRSWELPGWYTCVINVILWGWWVAAAWKPSLPVLILGPSSPLSTLPPLQCQAGRRPAAGQAGHQPTNP